MSATPAGSGVCRLLEVVGQLEQLRAHGGDAVGEYWAAIEPAGRLGWSRRLLQPVGKASAVAGALESRALAGEVGQLRELREDHECREPVLASEVAAESDCQRRRSSRPRSR